MSTTPTMRLILGVVGVGLIAAAGVAVAIGAADDDAPARSAGRTDRPLADGAPGETTAPLIVDGAFPATTVPPIEDPALPAGDGVTPATAGEPVDECPTDHVCQALDVSCPSAPVPAPVEVAVGTATGPRRGVLVLFSGGTGDLWWDGGQEPAARGLDALRRSGIDTVQVRWVEGWTNAPDDAGTGLAEMACRPATLLRALNAHLWPFERSLSGPGICGFCASGNSGGATQVVLSLTHHGLDAVLDAAVPTSGPPHAALGEGCLASGGDPFAYDASQVRDIDAAYGRRGGGPCEEEDESFVAEWDADDPAGPAADLDLGGTRVEVVLGDRDDTVAIPHARLWIDAARAVDPEQVTDIAVADMGHRVERSEAGVEALVEAVLSG